MAQTVDVIIATLRRHCGIWFALSFDIVVLRLLGPGPRLSCSLMGIGGSTGKSVALMYCLFGSWHARALGALGDH